MTNEHGCIFAGDFAISLTMSSPSKKDILLYYLVDFVDHCTKSHLFLNLVTLYLKAIPVCVTQAGQAGPKLGS